MTVSAGPRSVSPATFVISECGFRLALNHADALGQLVGDEARHIVAVNAHVYFPI